MVSKIRKSPVKNPAQDWFDYKLENDERFLRRIEDARKSLRAGKGTKIEDINLD